MALRRVAFCAGEYIGIESIYTVIDGKQVNDPEKLHELRKKSRNNELFCPCGCGSNLTMVAGDRNLREQHFRIRSNEQSRECRMTEESALSIDSKIVLKCWLDDKLQDRNLAARVQIHAVDDSSRKFEFTFLSVKKRIALDYWYTRADISDEKINILASNSKGINIFYIVDGINGGCGGQYPEALMKLQKRQGYCLLLNIEEADYFQATMKAVFYYQDNEKLWREHSFTDGPLAVYSFNAAGQVTYRGKPLNQLLTEEFEALAVQLREEKVSKLEQERLRKQYERRIEEEAERKRSERQKLLEKQKEEAARRKSEKDELRRIESARKLQESNQRQEDFQRNLEDGFLQQEKQVLDGEGVRWIKCEFCGKIAKVDEFSSYGGENHINLGICYECQKNNPLVEQKQEEEMKALLKKKNPDICPECGSHLVKRIGPYGPFLGCSNYPNCTFKSKLYNC